MSTLTAMPSAITAGTTVAYTRSFPDYPASDGWSMAVVLSGAKVLKADAVASADDFVVTLTAEQTATLAAGTYDYAERVTKAGESFDVARGKVSVAGDPFTAEPGGLKSSDAKLLDIVEKAIAGTLEAGMAEFQIAGRAVKYWSPSELLKLRGELRAAVAGESTGKLSRTHLIRFTPIGRNQ